jgi:hypothetical protein
MAYYVKVYDANDLSQVGDKGKEKPFKELVRQVFTAVNE